MKKYIPKILFIYLLLQPFLDVVAGLGTIFKIPNIIGITVRLTFLIYCGLYLFFYTKEHKKQNRIYLSLLTVYLITFSIYTIITKDFSTIK